MLEVRFDQQDLTAFVEGGPPHLVDARGVPVDADGLLEADQGASPLQRGSRLEVQARRAYRGRSDSVVVTPGHEPDDRVGMLGDLLEERQEPIDAHDDDRKRVLFLDAGRASSTCRKNCRCDSSRTADRLIPWPPGSREAPPGPPMNHREGLIGELGQDVRRRIEQPVGFSVKTSTR